MRLLLCITLLFIISKTNVFGQDRIEINAKFDVENKSINIHQFIEYKNTSNDTLNSIYLNDWNNAYSTKTTPLAKRFTEEFNNKFHFAKNEDRGFTTITSIKDQNNNDLSFTYLKEHPDVVKVNLRSTLQPNQSYTITLTYIVVVPNDTFTNYGVSNQNDYHLKYWYITPAIYNGDWQFYSNKNLDDLFIPKANITMQIEHPLNYQLFSELNTTYTTQFDNKQISILSGNNRVNTNLSLTKFPVFKYVKTDKLTIISDIKSEDVIPHDKAIITDKIANFITSHLGEYPHEIMFITETDYKKDPLYGLNQLPDFIRPFPNNFQYELKLLKTALNRYLENTLLINPRKDYWLKDGLQIYFMMKYIEENYPDTKLLGSFANIWGVRSFHAADLNFNDQYNLFFMQMARTNRDQALNTSKDSLIKFNSNIASKYKAGIGLKYLDDYVNSDILETTILEFLNENKLQLATSKDFESQLRAKTNKDIDWFFEDYLTSRNKADFKIQNVTKTQDSITFTIKNKRESNFPVSLFTLKDDSIISKTWIEDIDKTKTLTIPRDETNKLVLNYDNTIPEINLRDNWKSLKGVFFNNKPLQFRLFKDVEDPYYNQVFFMPLVEYRNIYDGLTLGAKIYNKTILRKRLNYKISPQYSTKSKTLTGSTSVYYTHFFENQDLYDITYGASASYSSFAENAFVTVLTPYLTFGFRDDDNFRSNKNQFLSFRYLDISRDITQNPTIIVDEPDYSIFNVRYINSNPGLVNYYKWYTDLQFSNTFGKLSLNYEYRKLSESNRQLNLRLFVGTFLYNKTEANDDYFSFALDRPTDYLFDYNYLGRSEQSGIFSQQLIIAEGGFKSKLNPAYANQWMATANMSTTIWRYIEFYGDLGLVKNKTFNPKFVYDSGIRLNLVTDYFEVYFPLYSNLGWEIAQPNYDQKIRFKFTVDPQALLGLFRRKWY